MLTPGLHALLFTGCVLCHPLYAHAQDRADDTGVPRLPDAIEVKQAEASPLARVVLGGSTGLMYSDNIYRAKTGRKGDFIATAAPGLSLRTDMKQHEARARLRVEGGKYFDHSENDYVDVRADGRGKYAINDTLSLLADADLRRDHVDIGSFVDNPDRGAAEPAIYHQAAGNIGLRADNGAYYGLVTTGLNYLNYDNVDARGGGTIINDDRDRTEWNAKARTGVYVTPQWLGYIQGTLNRRDYRTQVDSTALFPKDSDGYGIGLGMAYGEEKAPTRFDINGGYLAQNYDDPFLPDIATLGLEAEGRWQVSDAFRLKGGATRGIEENTLFGASGHIMTRLRAGFDFAFAPQWSLQGDARFTHNDFEVNPVSGVPGRTDKVVDTSLLAEYNIAGDYYAGLEYIYVNRHSTDSTVEYASNAVVARISLKY